MAAGTPRRDRKLFNLHFLSAFVSAYTFCFPSTDKTQAGRKMKSDLKLHPLKSNSKEFQTVIETIIRILISYSLPTDFFATNAKS